MAETQLLLNRFAPTIGATTSSHRRESFGGYMRARALFGAVGGVAVIGCFAMAPAARAQDVYITAPAPFSAGSDAPKPLTQKEEDVLSRALVFDPAVLIRDRPPRTLKPRTYLNSAGVDVKNTDKPDGSSSVVVKRPLTIDTPDIDSNVGADVNVAAQPSSVYQARGPLPGSATNDGGSAAAWASIGVHNLASVDARVDPANDQGKIGGKLSHAVPVGKDLSVTLEDSYSVTESFSPGATSAAPATVSSTLAGPPPVTATPSEQVFDNSKLVKFNVAPTGTSFGTCWTTASNDPVTHRTLSADQKLFGPLHITTSVTDVGQPTENKTITAGFKLNW